MGTLRKQFSSGVMAKGAFGMQNFVWLVEGDVYRCRASARLVRRYINVEDAQSCFTQARA